MKAKKLCEGFIKKKNGILGKGENPFSWVRGGVYGWLPDHNKEPCFLTFRIYFKV
jgi:hypothetical protein